MAGSERLSASNRSFLELESSRQHMHVGGAFVFEAGPLRRPDGSLDIERLRAYVGSQLHKIPRYRQRIARIPMEGHPVWVDDERFNLHYHVRHTCLPPPGDERLLKRLCGRILSQQLDRGKPLWEIWIVEGLEHDRIALVTKTHHCVVDGDSGNEIMRELLSPRPVKEFDEGPLWLPTPAPTRLQLLVDAGARRAATPWLLARHLRQAARDPGRLREQIGDSLGALWQAAEIALRPVPDTPMNQPTGPHRRFDCLALDLALVKGVKDRLGGTVNDVVLATVAGAVGDFLTHRGVTRERQRQLDFRAFCPVSVHTAAEGELGNRVSPVIAPLPIHIPDARERLARVSETMGNLKASKQALGAEVLTSVSEWIAPTLFSLAARVSSRARASNLMIANMPGPQIPLYLLGSRMTEAYPLIPLFERQALGIALFSYGGGLYWGFTADWDLFPDLPDFTRAIERSFDDLCASATQ